MGKSGARLYVVVLRLASVVAFRRRSWLGALLLTPFLCSCLFCFSSFLLVLEVLPLQMLQFISKNVVYETVSAKPEAVHFHDALIAKSLAAASPIVYGVVSDATDDELDEMIGDGVAECPDASVDEVVHPSCRQVGGFGFPDGYSGYSASMDAGAIHDSKTLTLAVASGHAESVESSDDNCSKEELMAQLEEARVNHQRLKLCCQMLIVSDDTKNGQTGSFQKKWILSKRIWF